MHGQDPPSLSPQGCYPPPLCPAGPSPPEGRGQVGFPERAFSEADMSAQRPSPKKVWACLRTCAPCPTPETPFPGTYCVSWVGVPVPETGEGRPLWGSEPALGADATGDTRNSDEHGTGLSPRH